MKYRYRYTNVPSVIQGDVPEDEAWCFVTGHTGEMEFHHIMNGNKKSKRLSEEYGFWVWLEHDAHDRLHHTPEGIAYQRTLKQKCQIAFEREHPRSLWFRLFHKNYL